MIYLMITISLSYVFYHVLILHQFQNKIIIVIIHSGSLKRNVCNMF